MFNRSGQQGSLGASAAAACSSCGLRCTSSMGRNVVFFCGGDLLAMRVVREVREVVMSEPCVFVRICDTCDNCKGRE